MKKGSIPTNSKFRGFSALVAVALSLQGHVAAAKAPTGEQSPASPLVQANVADIRTEQRARITYDAYILGPGDILQIELLDLPELSGTFSIGPDGTIYLPRLRVLYVEGLTVEEFRIFLTKQFSTYVRDPEIYIRPVAYRPIRVYVGGEVKRPGFYTLSETLNFDRVSTSTERQLFQASEGLNTNQSGLGQLPGGASIGSSENSLSTFGKVFPTVFDAIRRARGITPYSDLSKVEVIRKRAEGLGGGRIKTTLNFLELITEGDESQNIQLFDGDTLKISKSPVVLQDQLLKAGQSNLSPQFLEVFVTGRVNMPGGVKLPQGSSLNQAISLAGGTKIIKGKVEFVRFNRTGTIDRRIFSYNPRAAADAPNNPILASGDLIRVNDSIISGSIGVLNELTQPFVSIYTAFSLFNIFSD